MLNRLIAEATECDFKVAVETKKPKSWLKSVSAFANGVGGSLLLALTTTKTLSVLPTRRRMLKQSAA